MSSYVSGPNSNKDNSNSNNSYTSSSSQQQSYTSPVTNPQYRPSAASAPAFSTQPYNPYGSPTASTSTSTSYSQPQPQYGQQQAVTAATSSETNPQYRPSSASASASSTQPYNPYGSSTASTSTSYSQPQSQYGQQQAIPAAQPARQPYNPYGNTAASSNSQPQSHQIAQQQLTTAVTQQVVKQAPVQQASSYAPTPRTPQHPMPQTATIPSSTVTHKAYQHGSGPTGGVISVGNPTKCHKIDYEIHGSEMQLVEITLDPNETVIAEAGALMYLDDDITFEAKLGDGSKPDQSFFGKLFSAGKRWFTGESLFMTHFSNDGNAGGARKVAFAAPYPGTIIPVNMAEINQETLICQKDAFLCAAHGTALEIHFHKKLGAGFFGGEGFILQKLVGDGMAFVHAGGCVVKKELTGGRVRVDTGCLVAFTSGIDFGVSMVPGLTSILFGGEGLFLATLEGHGTVWLQSLPFSRLCDRVVRSAPSLGGSGTGESTLFGGALGNAVSGDGVGGSLGVDGGAMAQQALMQGMGSMFR